MTKNFALTSDQTQALNIFNTWLEKDLPTKPFLLSGFAGSGKTLLSMKFLKIVEKTNTSWTVAAPTHKAVDVLRKAMKKEALKPTWHPSTIHRLLRLKIKRKGDLELVEKTSKTSKSLENLGLLLIDETSMVDSELLEIVLATANKFKTRLVFVGDSAQLPPVGELLSPVFEIKESLKANLQQVVRHQGPVLKLASLVREEHWPCLPPPVFPQVQTEKGSIGSFSPNQWLDKAKKAIRLSAENNDPDFARILCYTNKYVERLVPHARRAMHGDMAEEMSVLPGETLISRRAVMSSASIDLTRHGDDSGVLIGTNTEMVVKDVTPEVYNLADLNLLSKALVEEPIINTYKVKVSAFNDEFNIRLLPEIGSIARKYLDTFLEKLASYAKQSSPKQAKSIWKSFFQLRDSFASLGPASVLTVHRSQGSTFKEVYIADDIFWPKDLSLRKQLVYVAISRASTSVNLLGSTKTAKTSHSWNKIINNFD